MKIKDETIAMLRKELKQFKEDAATFASNRAMYTTRNEELKAKVIKETFLFSIIPIF